MTQQLASVVPPFERTGLGAFPAWLATVRDALLRPAQLYGRLAPGALGPALRFAAINLALCSSAAAIADDALWETSPSLGSGLARAALTALGGWLAILLWTFTAQAAVLHGVLRLLGARAPFSLAQRAGGYLTAVFVTFGVVGSVAGMAPESGPAVVLWYLSACAALVLLSVALYQLARGAYQRSVPRALAAVLVFSLLHTITATVLVGGVLLLFTPR